MTYDELTQEEKDMVADADQWVRGALAALYAYMVTTDFPLKLAYWDNGIQAILDSLNAGEILPNPTNLAGAEDLTKGQLTFAKAWLQSIYDDMNTNLPTVVKAIGINAGG